MSVKIKNISIKYLITKYLRLNVILYPEMIGTYKELVIFNSMFLFLMSIELLLLAVNLNFLMFSLLLFF